MPPHARTHVDAANPIVATRATASCEPFDALLMPPHARTHVDAANPVVASRVQRERGRDPASAI